MRGSPRVVRAVRWLGGRTLVLSAVLAGVALLAAAVAFLLYFLVVAEWGPLARTDAEVLESAHELASQSPPLVVALKGMSRLGVPLVYQALALVLAAVLVWGRRVLTAAYVVTTIFVGLELAPLLKALVRRPRPIVADPVAGAGGFSFPSGHAVGVTVVALTSVVAAILVFGISLRRGVLAAAVVLVLVMCAARVVLGVHYVSDVVAGCLIGASWVGLMTSLALPLTRWDQRREHSVRI